MITELAKMTTGLVVRGGLGLPLRLAVFAGMAWGAWLAAPPAFAWAMMGLEGNGNTPAPIALLLPFGLPIFGAVIALIAASDGKAWGFGDFLRRAPFTAWCLMTDDGESVPVWAILVWPVVAAADFVLAVGTLVAVPCWAVWWVARTVWRVAWRGLSYKPLDRG